MTHPVPQLPLALRYPPEQRLDTYLQAPVGLLEHLRALAEGQPVGAVFLHGDHGVGKTHLAVGISIVSGHVKIPPSGNFRMSIDTPLHRRKYIVQ